LEADIGCPQKLQKSVQNLHSSREFRMADGQNSKGYSPKSLGFWSPVFHGIDLAAERENRFSPVDWSLANGAQSEGKMVVAESLRKGGCYEERS
jgi:hypothetical protein